MSTMQLVADLKAANEDFEWYPTTNEIIGDVCRDIIKHCRSSWRGKDCQTLLDVGAGDGRFWNVCKKTFTKPAIPTWNYLQLKSQQFT